MNVLFHTTAAIGIAALIIDTRKAGADLKVRDRTIQGSLAFLLGIMAHGALDYIPHCYPINSKIDVIGGLLIISVSTLLAGKTYRLIVAMAFTGSIFPDIMDLSTAIANKYGGLNLPVYKNFFPWHWKEYSGSIYSDNCSVSAINHFMMLISIIIICWVRRRDLQVILSGK